MAFDLKLNAFEIVTAAAAHIQCAALRHCTDGFIYFLLEIVLYSFSIRHPIAYAREKENFLCKQNRTEPNQSEPNQSHFTRTLEDFNAEIIRLVF